MEDEVVCEVMCYQLSGLGVFFGALDSGQSARTR